MRLIELSVQDVRRFRGGPYRLAFDARGTVLAGPNEVGKSTLFEMVRRALFDRARTTAQWVEHMVPAGEPGARPTVSLVFEHGGERWTVDKTFGRSGQTTLRRLVGDDWIAEASGDDAEDRLLALLGARRSRARDGLDPDAWGAFQWLFVPQDRRHLPPEGSDAAGRIGLDQAGVGPEFDAVQALVTGEHQRVFTPTGKLSKNAELTVVTAEVEELSRQRAELAEQVRAFDDQQRAHEEILRALPTLERDVDAGREELEAALGEAVDLSGAEGRTTAARAAREQARTRAEQARRVLADRERLDQVQRDKAARHEQALKRRAELRAAAEEVERRYDEARTQAATAGDHKATLERVRSDAVDCLRVRGGREEIKARAGKLALAAELDRAVLEATRALEGDPPADDAIAGLEQLQAQVLGRREALRRAALRVVVHEPGGLSIRVDDEPLATADGVALRVVEIAGPEGGQVTVEGPTARARELADEADRLQQQLDEALRAHGVEDLAGLRDLRDRRRAQHEELRVAQAERRGHDRRDTAAIERENLELEAEIVEAERRRAARDPIAEHDAMPLAALKALIDQLADDVGRAEEAFGEARTLRQELQAAARQARSEADDADDGEVGARTDAAAAAAELDRHRDRHGSTDACRTEADAARSALHDAEAEAERREQELARLQRDATSRRQTAQRSYERMEARLQQQRASARSLRDQLEAASTRGIYSRLAEVERRLEAEQERLGWLTLRADALRLLKTTLDDVHGSAVSRVVEPIRAELDQLLASVTLGRYTTSALDAALQPRRLSARAADTGGEPAEGDRDAVPFEDGSQGLRELVETLVRLCVATHLCRTGPQTVILDDPCVHVSRERTERLVDQINQLVETHPLQIVVLTHRASEFAGLVGEVVDVPSIGPGGSGPTPP